MKARTDSDGDSNVKNDGRRGEKELKKRGIV